MEVPLSIAGAYRPCFQVAWRPSFTGVPVNVVNVKLAPYRIGSSISTLNSTLLYASSISTAVEFLLSFAIVRIRRMSIWLRLVTSLAWHPPLSGGRTFLLSRSSASFLAMFRPISFLVVFCIVSVQFAIVLDWFGDWLEETI